MKRGPRNTPAACDETLRWRLIGEEHPDLRVRVERHLSHCSACQQAVARIDDLGANVRAAAPDLDDVRRARLQARLTPALDDLAARFAAQDASPWWRFSALVTPLLRVRALAGLIGLAAVTITVAALFPLAERVRPRPSAMPSLPTAAALDLSAGFAPFRAEGVWPRDREPVVIGVRVDRLDVPAGAIVRTRLGRQAKVSVIGPARARITVSQPGLVEVALDEGRLIADYDHQAGGKLRIQSPDGITNVVGTLFSVNVEQGHTRVAVARGRVVVADRIGSTQIVSGGESWDIGRPTTVAVEPQTRHLFEEHERASASAPPLSTAAMAAPASVLPGDVASARPTTAVTTPTRTSTGGRPRRVALAVKAAPTATERSPASALPALALSGAPSVLPPPQVVPLPSMAPPPAPSVAPAAPAGPSETTPPTPEAQYRAAEDEMRRRDWAAAESRLGEIVARGQHEPIEDVARYELAQLALRRGDRARARRLLDDLSVSDREPALREPAGFLRCEVAAELGDVSRALTCFEDFRQVHPSSAHDRAALGWMLRLSSPAQSCNDARGLFDEYLRRYPGGPEATLARERRARCPR